MTGLMPHTTTATELQRNYKKVARRAKKLKEPVTVLSNNKPELVVMDYGAFNSWQGDKGKMGSKNKKGFDNLFGSWSDEEADHFNKVIEDAFERVNPDDWK